MGLRPVTRCRRDSDNIVAPLLERQSQQGATVVRDAAAPPEERYRLWTKFQPTDDELARGARPGLYAMHSPDGLRWTPYPNQPTPPDQQCDTQNMLFWDHRIDQWVGYTRVRETQHADEATAAGHHIYRSIGRITSPDLERWTSTDIVLEPDRADLSIPRPVPPAEPEGPLPRPTFGLLYQNIPERNALSLGGGRVRDDAGRLLPLARRLPGDHGRAAADQPRRHLMAARRRAQAVPSPRLGWQRDQWVDMRQSVADPDGGRAVAVLQRHQQASQRYADEE